jgi:hypothetical protein
MGHTARDGYREPCPTSFLAFDPNVASVQLDELLDQGKTDAAPLEAAALRAFDSM